MHPCAQHVSAIASGTGKHAKAIASAIAIEVRTPLPLVFIFAPLENNFVISSVVAATRDPCRGLSYRR
jgi:hypothetical protein